MSITEGIGLNNMSEKKTNNDNSKFLKVDIGETCFLYAIQYLPVLIMMLVSRLTNKTFGEIEYLGNVISVVMTDSLVRLCDGNMHLDSKISKMLFIMLCLFAVVLYSILLAANSINSVDTYFMLTVVLLGASVYFRFYVYFGEYE